MSIEAARKHHPIVPNRRLLPRRHGRKGRHAGERKTGNAAPAHDPGVHGVRTGGKEEDPWLSAVLNSKIRRPPGCARGPWSFLEPARGLEPLTCWLRSRKIWVILLILLNIYGFPLHLSAKSANAQPKQHR